LGSAPGAKFGVREGFEKRGARQVGQVFDWEAEELAHVVRQVEPKMCWHGVRTGTWVEEKVSWQMSQCSMVSIVNRKVSFVGSG
jgi:hypothetical protein